MPIEIVNGYPCADCADIAKAKRGIDPAESLAESRVREEAAPDAALTATENVAEAGSPYDVRVPLAFARQIDRLV
ncbi:hypothetical protein [Rhabdaerophilum calidifontis]|uniref:hypothetical protein n=1 Tax=Rhabdaerophilum calidifontis TaxID=2604328 RepID=UPI001239DC95|nr:hypothetical protein [Rhabdaerophilum calidifontis]